MMPINNWTRGCKWTQDKGAVWLFKPRTQSLYPLAKISLCRPGFLYYSVGFIHLWGPYMGISIVHKGVGLCMILNQQSPSPSELELGVG